MASRRTSQVRTTVLATSLAAAATFSIFPAGVGHADAKPTLREVEQRVSALNAKVDVADEQYANSKIQLAATQRQAAVAQARVAAVQQALDTIKTAMGSVASAAYRSGGTDQFMQLVSTSSPQTFLDRASSLDRIAAGQSAQLTAAAAARHLLDSARADALAQQAAATSVEKQLAASQSLIQNALSEQTTLLNGLKASERRQFDAQQAAALLASTARASRSRSGSTPTYDGPASGQASVALQAAYAQLGKPYQWGGSGPSSFDCSGLTMWAWGHAGVSLSHSAEAQYGEGQHVSQANIQPGDLVFFGSPIHHVGMYVGNGNMIDAPQTGDVVRIQAAFRSDFVGASRP